MCELYLGGVKMIQNFGCQLYPSLPYQLLVHAKPMHMRPESGINGFNI